MSQRPSCVTRRTVVSFPNDGPFHPQNIIVEKLNHFQEQKLCQIPATCSMKCEKVKCENYSTESILMMAHC